MKTIITLLLAILAAVTTPITKPNEPPHSEAFAAEFERDFPGEAYILRKPEDVTEGVLKARETWDVYSNAFGEMPDVCPWCKRDLDWNDFIRITTESTDEQTDKEETK